jgi:dienelactone hydrolase
MSRSACLCTLLAALLLTPTLTAESDPTAVLQPGEKLKDRRLGPQRTLNGKDFFLTVPPTRQAWDARRQAVREQVLVATGLWPPPPRTPLKPVVHGKVDREDYTVEKVFFASLPGHYVSGNLYRPRGKSGRVPGVLCPHGHWRNGRFYDAGEEAARAQIQKGAEKTMEGARYPLQARCAQLARMGCVVFHYDMVGVADSTALRHATAFTEAAEPRQETFMEARPRDQRLGPRDADAELHLQSFMGLQTWNSIRALDFLLSLPEVDPARIGVTGASGGGTQTFMLGAVDDRPAVAFPAVMVSTEMQGGCICENCSYLRQGTGNIELAGLFAPRPLAMSGANDWTLHIEERGLPELKKLYQLYDAEDRVLARCFPQFEHNYNQVSRELMYNWFNKHLRLGQPEPVSEKPLVPVPPAQLSVYDGEHPRPADTADAATLRRYLTATADRQIEALRPRDTQSLAEFRRVLGTALRVMIHDELPAADQVDANEVGDKGERDGLTWRRYLLSRKGQGEAVPAFGIKGPQFDGTVVVWVHPRGKASLFEDGKLTAAARQVLDGRAAILALDAFGTGEFGEVKPRVDEKFAGYTFGYNRPLLAQRVHDVLTAVAFVRGHERTKQVHLLGWEEAGPWVLLARSLCGEAVARTAADFAGFRFEKVRDTADPMMLPGALKYGGLAALAALAAPAELYDHNHRGTGSGRWLRAAYQAAGATDKLHRNPDKMPPEQVVGWLLH